MSKMNAQTLCDKAVDIAKNYKTLYVMGCFGAPMTAANKTRYINNGASNGYNAKAARKAMINAATAGTFGFDCVNLIKGILWGWCGDASKRYGGAVYPTKAMLAAGAVPDIGADTMITRCTEVSTTGWASMVPGEAVWLSGHIGIYIGNGLAVESSPSFANKVQITAVANIGKKAGYSARTWTKHGKLPWVDYTGAVADGSAPVVSTPTQPSTSAQEPAVGAVVTFTGTQHYTSSNSTSPKSCKPGEAKVTAVAKGAKHPYHLVKTTGSTSTVYGWVDAADIATGAPADITKGSSVKVKAGAKTYTGGGLAAFVYQNTYTVLELNGDRAVIGQGKAVTAAVNTKDLTPVG